MTTERIETRTSTADKNGTVLTKTQKSCYERDGYLVIKDFISPSLCQSLMKHAIQLIDNFDPEETKAIFSSINPDMAKQRYFLESGDKIHFFFEENAFDANGNLKTHKRLCINKIGHALHELDSAFFCLTNLIKVAAICHDLNIQLPEIVQSMYLCKQPFFGGEVSCHQDSTYLYIEGRPITGLWFALEDANRQNGCLWAIPGGHRTPLKSRMIRDQHDHITTEVYDETAWELEKMQPLEVSRGSLVILHGLLPHMSHPNTSEHSRHAYSLHIMSGHDHFAEDNWLQRKNKKPFSRIVWDYPLATTL